MATVAIIGAGLAGLAAAQELARVGHGVTLYEKSRGVGGRAATRRVEGFSFDHGAQYLKAPTAELAALAAAAPGLHDIGRPVWLHDADGRISPGDPAMNAEPKLTWAGGITALARHMARGLEIRLEATVAALAHVGGWELRDGAGQPLGRADAVLLTAPAAQSAAILAASELGPARGAALIAELARASYRRCISVALAYEGRPELPWYALVNPDRGHPISWLACEHDKPGRAPDGKGLLVAQMAPGWSAAYWEALERGTFRPGEAPAPLAEVVELAGRLAGAPGPPLWLNVQRWRYALPDTACDEAVLNGGGGGIYVAGDMLAGQGRLHLAIESGWRVGRRMAAELAEA